ncbi:MAG: hypothetical protein LBT55_06305 [Clostridiaceae bacterium]|jgi:hypothetical protein|nr:hypothetical protein [Clostridiaceae bacterium]
METEKELQQRLDTVKWIESEAIDGDTCGTYEYCIKCDKELENPCAKAYGKTYDKKTAAQKTKSPAKTAEEKPVEAAPVEAAEVAPAKKPAAKKTAAKPAPAEATSEAAAEVAPAKKPAAKKAAAKPAADGPELITIVATASVEKLLAEQGVKIKKRTSTKKSTETPE